MKLHKVLSAAMAFSLLALPVTAGSKQVDWDRELVKVRHLMATNNVEEAMVLLDKFLKKHPESGAVHTEMGKCLKKRNRPGDAKAEFKRATEVEPEYGEAWYELAAMQQADKEYAAAISSFERYLQIMPYSDRKDAVKDRINFCKAQG